MWRVARSLDVLLGQLNRAYPGRSIASDGSIGDAAHATRDSDHNPHYILDGWGIVTARDYTNDPAHGFDAHALAERLRLSTDRRIKYVISNGRIFAGAAGPSPWTWRTYPGTNPHTKHIHLSVVASRLCDDTTPWTAVNASTLGSRIPDLDQPTPAEDDMTPEQQQTLDNVAWLVGQIKGETDRLDDIHAQVDRTAWGVLDGGHGLRQMVAALTAQVGALQGAVAAIASSGSVDAAAVTAAAERGAIAALANLTLVTKGA